MKFQYLMVISALAVSQVQSLNASSRIISFPLPPSPILEEKHVALFTKDQPNIPRCTGVIILRNWFLTTASCVYGLSPIELTFKVGGTIGEPASGKTHFEEGEHIEIIKNHPLYSEINLAYDIALVKPKETFITDGYVIENEKENWVQKSFKIRGYGGVDTGIQSGDIHLNEARVILQPNIECRKEIPNVPAYKLCSIGSHLCIGDQGGPLISERTNKLRGIISTPLHILNSCGRNSKQVETYTDLENMRPWIKQITGTDL